MESYEPALSGGNIRIANEVVGIIAGLAATEVDGVAGMSGGVVDGLAELLKKKNLAIDHLEGYMNKGLSKFAGVADVNSALEWIRKQAKA